MALACLEWVVLSCDYISVDRYALDLTFALDGQGKQCRLGYSIAQ